jgi:uncharacterized RmlC-like cupin family protein
MIDYQMDRIQYLTRKAQMGVITPYEQNELAQLLGRDQQEFNNQNGLSLLIGIALAAIAAAIIVEILTGGER